MPRATRRIAAAIGRLLVLAPALRARMRERFAGFPGLPSLDRSSDRIHPYDRVNGTDTCGVVRRMGRETGPSLSSPGPQPSVLRHAVAALPAVDAFTFLDLECGKGRALLVASEFPFRDILGVESSAPLGRIANQNAVRIARRYPRRTEICVALDSSRAFPLPSGDLVLFLYHPCSPAALARVIAAAESALAAGRRLFVIYYNPVAGRRFDDSNVLHRRLARTLTCAPEERGFGSYDTDTLVIWQGGNGLDAEPGANDRIVVTRRGRRATLVPTPAAPRRRGAAARRIGAQGERRGSPAHHSVR